jgi:hypothetical protein
MCFGLRKNTKLLSDHDCYTVGLTNVVFCEIVQSFENTAAVTVTYIVMSSVQRLWLCKVAYNI